MQIKLIGSFAIALLITPLLACGFLGQHPNYKWHVILELDPSAPNREAATLETVEVLNSRLNHLGVIGFRVSVVGAPRQGRVRLDLPEVADRERFKNFIVARGSLQLVHVVSDPSPAPCQIHKTEDEAKSTIKPGQDRKVLPYTASPRSSADNEGGWVVVEHPPIIDGRDVRTAAPVPLRGDGTYEINFTLKPEAATKFGAWTAANINQYLGVILNDEVKSIAFIKSQIFDTGMISGHFTKQAAEDLAQILMSGPLPAALKIVEEADNRSDIASSLPSTQ
jgi:protein-export membrane protein SecD